jgi:hypothetical protein
MGVQTNAEGLHSELVEGDLTRPLSCQTVARIECLTSHATTSGTESPYWEIVG